MHVEIDCTPEEMRRAVGLPDLTPLHERYIAMTLEAMQGRFNPEAVEGLMRGWAPMGEAGMAMWRRLLEGASGKAGD